MIRIRSKEEVLRLYEHRYPELDHYFLRHLEEEYDRYYDQLWHLGSKEEALHFFENEIKKNEQMYKNNALSEGIERPLHNQYMAVLAAYGLIVFFRDNMLEE